MTINVESEEVKNLILEMDRNKMIKIINKPQDLSEFQGILKMNDKRIEEFLGYIEESRKGSDDRLPL
jgi:hypothetical protein